MGQGLLQAWPVFYSIHDTYWVLNVVVLCLLGWPKCPLNLAIPLILQVSFGGGGGRCRCPMIWKVGIGILEVWAKLRKCLKAGWKGHELFEVGSSHLTSIYLFNDFELCPNEFVKHKYASISISFKIWMQLANAKFILLCNKQTKKQSYALNVTNNNSLVSHIKEWNLEDLLLAFILCQFFLHTSILLALLIDKRLFIGVRLSTIAFKY
jgi:hypothetical protein